MFYLWLGVMAGTLLVYLWMRGHAIRSRPWWRSWRWWVATFAALILLIPVLWDAGRVAFGSFGVLEAFKAVLLPWAAGIGFGIWIYLTIGPLSLSHAVAPAPMASAEGAAAPRKELSFIPIAVAMLFVTVIVSDDRYGWLARLQKVAIGGGSLELAPAPSREQSRADYSPGEASKFGQTGDNRVQMLVEFMTNLGVSIRRDFNYAQEVFGETEDVFKNDESFALKVIFPLGTHLGKIRKARGYNDIGVLIDRPFVESFRVFVLSHRERSKRDELWPDLAAAVKSSIKTIWLRVCRTETQLRALGDIEELKAEDKPCDKEAEDAIELLDAPAAAGLPGAEIHVALRPIFNPKLPYGILLSAMLLNAAGEIDLAVKDLDQWVGENWPDSRKDFRWFGVYRALNQSTLLLMADDPTGQKRFLMIMQIQKLVEIADKLLNAMHHPSSQLSWREQRSRFEKGDGLDLMWHMGVCSNDLTELFKRFMNTRLTAANNLAYFLSQNTEFAERENLMGEMERHADYLGKKVNMRCLQLERAPTDKDGDETDDRENADRTQAIFLDTAAAVELVLADRETLRTERRRRLCSAQKYEQKAVDLYRATLAEQKATALGFDQHLLSPAMLDKWEKRLEAYSGVVTWVDFVRQVSKIKAKLSAAGFEEC